MKEAIIPTATYTVEELSNLLGVGKRKALRMIAEGSIKAKNISSKKRVIFRILGEDILTYLKQ